MHRTARSLSLAAAALLPLAALTTVAPAAFAVTGPIQPPVCTYADADDGATQTVISGVTAHLRTFCHGTTARMTATAAHGDVSIASSGALTYRSDPTFTGVDTITVTAVITRVSTGPASTFDVTVAGMAETVDDEFTLDSAGAVTDRSVLENDVISGGRWSIQAGVTPPAHGTLTLDPVTGDLEYHPDAGYVGDDGFLYRLNGPDGATSNVSRVTFHVQ
ncbi:Ig-like domain-containing protein [Herbiconiux sp. YIM B11900]|uniref:Ig-like domain-containing protein n=1 Tax=Herbiconiux sp. YIM B11900 TaxID=3404131 RepID=UPI003F8714FE